MKKYIDAEKMKESLKRRYTDITVPVITSEGGLESYFRRREIRDIIKLIDSLQQEQPEVDLKNEIIIQWSKCNPTDEGMGSEYAIIAVEQFAAIARHFYELGLKAKEGNK